MNKKGKKKLKHGELRDVILESIANNLIALKGYGPSLPHIVGSLIKINLDYKKENIHPNKVIRALKDLEKREIISIENKNDQVIVQIKEKGEPLILRYSVKALLDFKKKKKNWDKRWFMVIFDVPEEQRNKRVYLRRYLIQIGFYQYQKSVYLFPFECKEEIELIKKIVAGSKYMKYIVATEIENESVVKRFFKL